MDTEPIELMAERLLRDSSRELLEPRPGECLVCFVDRQVARYGCTGDHRFVTLYRDRRAPRATALFRNLANMGACCCDCEVTQNAYGRREVVGLRRRPRTRSEEDLDRRLAVSAPPCLGVGRGSVHPCERWGRHRHVRW